MAKIASFLSLLMGLNLHNTSNQEINIWKYAQQFCGLKGNEAYLKNYVMNENDALSEYNKIPLGHNRTNGAVYSKMYFKVDIYSAF